MANSDPANPDTPRADASGAGPLPPYRVFADFVPQDFIQALLQYAKENETKFEATTTRGNKHNPAVRVSAFLRLSESLERELEKRILALTPQLVADLRVTPFTPTRVELELVAHGDGAFYKRHIDTFTGRDEDTANQRLLSAVFYFHTSPKAFSGGALRFYAFGSSDSDAKFVDIEPINNTLVVFPSWAPHGVLAVSCPSKQFMDSRFAINCWVLRKRPRGTG